MDIASIAQKYITDRVVSSIANKVGMNPAMARTMAEKAVPMLLGGMSRNAAQGGDNAQGLISAITNDHDGGIFDLLNPDTPSPQPEASELMGQGQKILGHLFGANEAAVEQQLSAATGADMQSATKMLQALSPMLMGALGKEQSAGGLDAANILQGFTQYQQSDKGSTASKMLSSVLDRDGDGSVMDDVMNIAKKFMG